MPVEPQSPSPEPFERSPSPGYGSRGGASAEPKVRGTRFTEHDIQKRKLDKLLANPEKEVQLPEGMGLRMGARTPKDTLKNISGSSAAAGSGEFHIYKHSRRREYERVKAMERQSRELEEQAAFQARQAARDEVADAKTAKNRAKRQKRKQGARGNGTDANANSNSSSARGQGHEPDAKSQSSKFAVGARAEEHKDEANTVAEVQAAQAAAEARRAEVSITVVDDE